MTCDGPSHFSWTIHGVGAGRVTGRHVLNSRSIHGHIGAVSDDDTCNEDSKTG